jgi:DNA-directed RNA polymerase subunit F
MHDAKYKTIVSYLRSMASLDSDDMDSAIENIRNDLNIIEEEDVREDVSAMFQKAVGSDLWIKERKKTEYRNHFSDTLNKIADTIEKI